MTPLAFYDHARQSYADSLPIRGRHVAEFMIGGYGEDLNSGVDERGEFMICLHDFDGRRNYERNPWSPRVCVFTDAYGAFREFICLGGLDVLETATIRSNYDLTQLLLSLGLKDHSDNRSEREDGP